MFTIVRAVLTFHSFQTTLIKYIRKQRRVGRRRFLFCKDKAGILLLRLVLVVLGFGRKLFFLQAFVCHIAHQVVYDRKERNGDKHTEDAEEVAEYDDGDNDPQRGNTDRLTENFRTDDIAVQGLDRNNDSEQNECTHKAPITVDEDEQDTGDRTENRTDVWDDIGDTDDRGDEQEVGHVEYSRQKRQLQETQDCQHNDTDDQRVEDFTHKKPTEDLVCHVDRLHCTIVKFSGEDGGKKLFCPDAQLLGMKQNKEREKQPDDGVENRASGTIRRDC